MKIEMNSSSLTNRQFVISNLANSVLKMRLFNRRNYHRFYLRRSTGRVEDQSVPNYA